MRYVQRLEAEHITTAWLDLLAALIEAPQVSPRGKPSRELRGVTLHLRDSLGNVLVNPLRSPSYRFMVAEWLYILFGHDDVETISRYNKHIAEFSDDGVSFNGNYGVPINEQWQYVRNRLRDDSDTRQAIIVIWRPNPRPSKDIPCTLTLQFFIRDGRLETHASMRSSDVWLGLPYDVFNFTMLGNILAHECNVAPGSFTIHLGSSHLYETDRDKAIRVLKETTEWTNVYSPRLRDEPPAWLHTVLRLGEFSQKTVRFDPNRPDSHIAFWPWWHYACVMQSKLNITALGYLRQAFEERR